MSALIALCVISAVSAAVLVITASMLSSRISRQEDFFLADDQENGHDGQNFPGREAPQSFN